MYRIEIDGVKVERVHSHWEFKIKLEHSRGKMGELVKTFVVYAWSISTQNTRTRCADYTENFNSLQEAKQYVKNWETPLPKDRYISIN